MSDELCPVRLTALSKDRYGIDYLVLSDGLGRHMPMLIHGCESSAIAVAAQGLEPQRPLTHDLLSRSVEKLGGRLLRVIVDDFWQDTFYAKLCVETEDGSELQVDCRPSDGVAIALRAKVPVLVRDDVMAECAVELRPSDEPDDDPADS